jgi:hypothetical protein
LEVVEIYEDWLYSIQFEEEDLNEYARVFREWHDLDYLEKFFTDNAVYINTPFWKAAGLNPDDPVTSARKVLDEADNLEIYIEKLVSNMKQGCKPDFDEYFHFQIHHQMTAVNHHQHQSQRRIHQCNSNHLH